MAGLKICLRKRNVADTVRFKMAASGLTERIQSGKCNPLLLIGERCQDVGAIGKVHEFLIRRGENSQFRNGSYLQSFFSLQRTSRSTDIRSEW